MSYINEFVFYNTGIDYDPFIINDLKRSLYKNGVSYSDICLKEDEEDGRKKYFLAFEKHTFDEKDVVMYKLNGKITKALDKFIKKDK